MSHLEKACPNSEQPRTTQNNSDKKPEKKTTSQQSGNLREITYRIRKNLILHAYEKPPGYQSQTLLQI